MMTSDPAPAAFPRRSGRYRGYAEAAALIIVATVAGLTMSPHWGSSAVDLIYLPAVLGAALLGGLRPALFSALASALAYNYFFTAPYGTLRVSSAADVVTILMLFLVAVVTSQLAASIRKQAKIAAAHSARNATIAGLARKLLSCAGEVEIGQAATRELAVLFACNAMMIVPRGAPVVIASAPAPSALGPADLGAATLALDTGKTTGRGAGRASISEWQFHPVRLRESVLAAIGLARDDGAPPLEPGQGPLLASLVDQIALALHREQVEMAAREFAASRAQDRLRSALLATIGQDLMPPITRMAGGVAELQRGGSAERQVVAALASEAARLGRYVDELGQLDLEVDKEPIAAGDVTIDLFRRTVTRDGAQVHLPPKEYAVLAELARHCGRVLSHGHLLRAVWGPAHESQIDYLRVAIRGLRQKLETDSAQPKLIVNEPAVGYRLVAG